jgi:hypothetical protein
MLTLDLTTEQAYEQSVILRRKYALEAAEDTTVLTLTFARSETEAFDPVQTWDGKDEDFEL